MLSIRNIACYLNFKNWDEMLDSLEDIRVYHFVLKYL